MRLTTRRWLSLLAAGLLGTGLSLPTQAKDHGQQPAAESVRDSDEDEADTAAEADDEEESASEEALKSEEASVRPRPAEMMPLAARSMLLDVQKVDGQYVAVGDRGNIVLSADGTHWNQVNGPVRAPLTAVHFPDAQHGYAVGHDAAILATTDGGKTWTLQQFKPAWEKPLLDVLFLDADRGFAVGAYGLFEKTTDGGKSWSKVKAPSICDDELHLNAIRRLNNGELLVIGEQGLLGISSDEGTTWARLESPYESSLFGAVPIGDKGALIYGMRGHVYLSTDVRQGGWRKLDTGSVATMFGGTTLPDGRIALVGLNGVVFTIDADGKVTQSKADAGTALAAVIPFDRSLLVVGESGVQIIEEPH
jgi:photosystem II stability/assembly factor-like uncharacterized protein